MPSHEEPLAAALAHLKRGELTEAERLACEILKADPNHAAAWDLRGLCAYQSQRFDEATIYLQKAVELQKSVGSFVNHLAGVYLATNQLALAEASIKRAVELEPNSVSVHLNLAELRHRQGQFQSAIESLRRVVVLQPRLHQARVWLGKLLFDAGQLDAAAEHFTEAWDGHDERADALLMLAAVERLKGQPYQAEQYLRMILAQAPRQFEALWQLGTLSYEQGKFAESLQLLSAAETINPRHAEVAAALGGVHLRLNRRDQAESYLQRALAIAPGSPLVQNNLASLHQARGDDVLAIACLERAIRLAPAFVEAYVNLAGVLQRQKRFEEALKINYQALEFGKDAARLESLASTLHALGRPEEAISTYRQAIEIDPLHAPSHAGLARSLAVTPRRAEALANAAEAVRLSPDDAGIHLHQALALLADGQWESGWREFEWRLHTGHVKACALGQPRWDGSPLKGKKLLIHGEQGLGAMLQFIRFAHEVDRREPGGVLLQVPSTLVPLLKSSGFQRITEDQAPPPPCDLEIPLLSLPALLGTTLENLPTQVPYLAPDPKFVEIWREGLRALTGLRVGIVWQGNPDYFLDHVRSPKLFHFAPLAAVPGVRLISLQRVDGLEQLADFKRRHAVLDLADELDGEHGPFMDTAAVIANLDLVITSDTAVAHLAGALGAPVWVALSTYSDWRWMHDRSDSPWYPTMRLFRQRELNAWPGVFEHMATELATLVSTMR